MYETGNLFSFEDVYLNLGCGQDIRNGYVNIDLEAFSPDVVVGDARKLDYRDESVDMIVAVNLLESFRQQEIFPALKEWNRVLKNEAELVIQVPLFRLIYDAYQAGELQQANLSKLIFGENRDEEQINKSIFDERFIRKLIEKAGFRIIGSKDIVEPEKDKFDIRFRAVKTGVPVPKREYELSQLDFNFAYTYEELQKTFMLSGLKPDSPLINVVWEASFYSDDIYSSVNREICLQLLESGKAEITIIPSDPAERENFRQRRFKRLLENDIRYKRAPEEKIKNLPYVWIRHQRLPNGLEPKGARWIIMQNSYYSTLPKNFIEIYQQADEIWTDSEFSRSAFLRSGINESKVHLIPAGVNTAEFIPIGNKHQLSDTKKFTFVYAGELNYLSGADILVDAFESIFSREGNARLFLCNTLQNNDDFSINILDKIKKFNVNSDSSEIILIEKKVTQEELAEIYRASNVFVSPCRSISFPVHQLEAMASGLALIATFGGALEEYTHPDFTYYLSSIKTSVGSEVDKQPLDGEAFVLLPDKEELAATMKTLYENPSELFIKGIKAALHARKHFTWRNSAMKILSRFEEIYKLNLNESSSLMETDKDFDMSLFEKVLNAYDKEKISDALPQIEGILNSLPVESKPGLFAAYLKVKCLISDNKINEAEEFLNELKIKSSQSADFLYLTALLSEAKSDFDNASLSLKELCKKWDELKYTSLLGFSYDAIHVKAADVLLKKGQDAEAMHFYTEAIKINPANYQAYCGAARCFYAIGAKREALSMVDSALNLKRDCLEAILLKEEISSNT